MTRPALQGIPNYDKLEIFKSGVATVNVPAGHSQNTLYYTEITHTLRKVPIVIASVATAPGQTNVGQPIPGGGLPAIGGVLYGFSYWVNFWAYSSFIQFQVFAANGTTYEGDWKIQYYLLRAVSSTT